MKTNQTTCAFLILFTVGQWALTCLAAAAVELNEALDNTTLVWTTGGPTPWFGQTTVTHDGVDAAQSGLLLNNQTNWIETTVTGPGVIEFWWKVSSEESYDFLRFFQDGSPQRGISGNKGWECPSFGIGPGAHALRWAYGKDRADLAGSDCGWVDGVTFSPPTVPMIIQQPTNQVAMAGGQAALNVLAIGQPPLSYQWRQDSQDLPGETNATLTLTNLSTNQTGFYSVAISNSLDSTMSVSARLTVTPAITLGEAVDAPQLVWTTSGDAPWMSECSVTTDGEDAVRSGYLDNLLNSRLQTITGPGTVSFWCKVSSPPFAMLIFSVNSTEKAWLSGELDWQQRTFVLTGKTNILEWKYYIDRYYATGSNCAWLDRVSFTPAEPPRITQQPVSQTVVSGSGARFSVGVDSIGQVTCKWLKNGTTITGSTTTNLILTSVTTNQAGNYSVIVSNSVGTAVSSNAVLQVLPPLDPNVATLGPAGRFGGWPGAMVSRSNYVYLAQAEGLQVLDVTGQQNPKEVARLDLNDQTASLAWQSNYLYAALRTGKLVIFDLTHPEQPAETGRCNLTFSWSAQIAVSGTNAYVACDDQLVRVMDVANPTAPRYLRSVTVPATAIAVSTNRAYVAGSQRLTVLDLSNPSNPTTLGFSPEGGQSIVVQGNYAFLRSQDGLRIFDISNPAAISRVAFYTDDGPVVALTIEGTLAYLAVGGLNGVSPAFRILDMANPPQPVPIGRLPVEEEIVLLAMKLPTAFLVQKTGFRVVDVTTPASPSSVTLRPVPSTVNQAVVVGANLYLATDLGPWIYRLDDPASPTLVKAYNDTPDLKQIFVADQRLYEIFYTETNTSVAILDATHPEAMNRLGSYNPQRVTQDLYARAGRLYLVNQDLDKSWLEVADVSNPAQATKLGERELPGPGRTFCIADNLAYVGWGDGTNNGVSLIDVSDPASLQPVGTILTAGIPTSLFATGNRFYLGSSTLAGWWTLEMYDVSQPAVPAKVTRVDGDGTIWGLDVKEDLVFAAISGHSVYLFKHGLVAFEGATVCESPAAIGLAVTPANTSGIGYAFTPDGSGSRAENYKAGYLGLTIQRYQLGGGQGEVPALILSGGQAIQQSCPGDASLSNEVTILTFTLSVDTVADWMVHSVGFIGSGIGGNELLDLQYVRLYAGAELLSEGTYVQDDGSLRLEVGRRIPAGGSLTLSLKFRFDLTHLAMPPALKVFQASTSVSLVNAEPVNPPLTEYTKRPPAPVIGGPFAIGGVFNLQSGKLFGTIQEAVDDSATHTDHTLVVCPGTYAENVNVTKSLLIRSSQGPAVTIVQALNPDNHVFRVSKVDTGVQQHTLIEGFTIQGATGLDKAGVYVSGNFEAYYVEVAKNIIRGNFQGVSLQGATNVILDSNQIVQNRENGIELVDGRNNSIRFNLISTNSGDGIVLRGAESRFNQILGNKIGTDGPGVRAWGNRGSGVLIAGGSDNHLGSRDWPNVISGNGSNGVILIGGATRNTIAGNYIGTDHQGTGPLGNVAHGMLIEASAGNKIGEYGELGEKDLGNVISGNTGCGIVIRGATATNNEVLASFVGCDLNGRARLANQQHGVWLDNAPHNQIGGNGLDHGNIISGNGSNGVVVAGGSARYNTVRCNSIGPDVTGTNALPNGGKGVVLDGASDNLVGGEMGNSANFISGHPLVGVEIRGATAVSNRISGNLIGTDVNGERPLPNTEGISIAGAVGNTIGGAEFGFGNLISGNREKGIALDGRFNRVQGNLIGTDLSGSNALGNAESGIVIYDSNNLVGGTDSGAGNVISGNGEVGLKIFGSSNQVQGNFIGTDLTGYRAIGNGYRSFGWGGVTLTEFSRSNVIGGSMLQARNLISGNSKCGIQLGTAGGGDKVENNRIEGNYIGTARDRSTPLPNTGHGILLQIAVNNRIGGPEVRFGNVIAYNTGAGVFAAYTREVEGNAISHNAIFGNEQLGINLEDYYSNERLVTPNDLGDRDEGPNHLQNFPVLLGAVSKPSIGTVIRGSINSSPTTRLSLEFFTSTKAHISGYGQGEKFLGWKTLRTDTNGNASFTFADLSVVTRGDVITATATDARGNSSEFCKAVLVQTATDSDFDGVLDWLESSAPNNGDGNKDGLADSQQANVISLPVTTSGHVAFSGSPMATLASSASLSGVKTRSIKDIPPLNQTFAPAYDDLFSFLLKTNPPGLKASALHAGSSEVFQVELFQSENSNATAYFRYGPTPDNPTNHWYRFDYDGTTGALIQTNKTTLYFVDGLRGDDDLTVNGIIVHDAGGPAVPWLLAFVNVQYWPDDQVELQLQSIPTRTYRIDASTNLVDWTGWATTNAVDHITDFLDTNAPASRQRFYRAVEWP